MALAFGNTQGKAIKSQVDSYKYVDGDNVVRIFGGILPRYLYWLKGTNNKDIPVECLAFDREKEKFNNLVVDHVPEFYPDLKCSWSYSINCIDVKNGGAVKVLNLKKKLFEQIKTAAEELGDPTDPETGWDIVFKRVKTGPHTFNVEYTLAALKCKRRALTAEELAAIAADPGIDAKYPRATPEEVLATLEKIAKGAQAEEEVPAEAAEAVSDL
jgi:hypothetical protein